MTGGLRALAGAAWLRTSPAARALAATATASGAAVAELQLARLRALLAHAAARSPGWRARLADAGVVVDGTVHLARFPALAPLTRAELSGGLAEPLLADDLAQRRWYRNASSGSTGEPAQLVQDRAYLAWARAVKATLDGLTGAPPGHPRLVVWGARRDQRARGPTSTAVRRWLKRERWHDASRVTERDLEAWTASLTTHRPRQVLGYAESLHAWAQHLLATGQRPPAPGAVLSTAGVLSDAAHRDLAAAFRAPVWDRYGAREVGDLGLRPADSDAFALAPLHALVEVTDEAGRPVAPGEAGEVVVTSLTNLAMPLIRYRIGDRAVRHAGPDDAGTRRGLPAGWPRLGRIQGRVTEHFVAADGSLVHPGALRTRTAAVTGVVAYQLVQRTPTLVEVRVVAADPGDATLEPRLHAALQPALDRLLGRAGRLTVQRVAALPPGPTGKTTLSYSLVRR